MPVPLPLKVQEFYVAKGLSQKAAAAAADFSLRTAQRIDAVEHQTQRGTVKEGGGSAPLE